MSFYPVPVIGEDVGYVARGADENTAHCDAEVLDTISVLGVAFFNIDTVGVVVLRAVLWTDVARSTSSSQVEVKRRTPRPAPCGGVDTRIRCVAGR